MYSYVKIGVQMAEKKEKYENATNKIKQKKVKTAERVARKPGVLGTIMNIFFFGRARY
mgnify:FL=1